jgi:hypothetical protein
VPGWLDEAMPWRRCARGPNRAWLDNVLIVAPTSDSSTSSVALQTVNVYGVFAMQRDGSLSRQHGRTTISPSGASGLRAGLRN